MNNDLERRIECLEHAVYGNGNKGLKEQLTELKNDYSHCCGSKADKSEPMKIQLTPELIKWGIAIVIGIVTGKAASIINQLIGTQS